MNETKLCPSCESNLILSWFKEKEICVLCEENKKNKDKEKNK